MVFSTQEFLLFTQELVHFTQEIFPSLLKKLRTPYSRNLSVPSYKEPKSPYNFFFHILIFNELFKFKIRTNGNIERRRALLWTVRASTFSLRSH